MEVVNLGAQQDLRVQPEIIVGGDKLFRWGASKLFYLPMGQGVKIKTLSGRCQKTFPDVKIHYFNYFATVDRRMTKHFFI